MFRAWFVWHVRDAAELERLLLDRVDRAARPFTGRALLGAQRLLLDRELRAIFEVIERDEPSHFEPYAGWLTAARSQACASQPPTRSRTARCRLEAARARLRPERETHRCLSRVTRWS